MEISEKVAYLKGLAEGLALDSDTKEGKLIAAIIDVLDDMAEKFVDLEDELCDVEDGLDAVSDDLSDVEQALYELDDDVDEDEDEDYDDDDESYFETTCPVCEEVFFNRFTHLPLYGLSEEQLTYMADAVLSSIAEMQRGE